MTALLLAALLALAPAKSKKPDIIEDTPAPAPAPAVIPAPPAPPPAAHAQDTSSRKALRLAVYELKVDGVSDRLGRIVTDALVDEIRKLQRISVVSMDEVRAMLDMEAQKQLVGCSDDSCLAEIADSLGVDGVVIGSLSKIGEESVFGLRRIDQREAKTLGQVTQRLQAANGEEFLAMIGPSVEELFPELPLRQGQERGVAPEVALRVNPPPLPAWVFWATGATAGGLAVAAGTSMTVNLVLLQQLEERSLVTAPQDGKAFADAQSQNDTAAVTTLAFAGGAVLVGTAAGVVALFTDWRGDAE